MIWAEKYRPKSLEDIAGHSEAIEKARRWAEAWVAGEKQKPLLIHGPTGAGKTLLATAVAYAYGFELFEINVANVRDCESDAEESSEDIIRRIAGLASVSRTLEGKRRLILFDEVEHFFEKGGGGKAIADVVKNAECPIIMTADDIWNRKIREIKEGCSAIEVKSVHFSSIARVLERICAAEGVSAPKDLLLEIARRSSGDVRSAINDLQHVAQGRKELTSADLGALAGRDRSENVFRTLQRMFRSRSFREATAAASNSDLDSDMLMAWVDENLFREFASGEELANAYTLLSRADVFNGRIERRQSWGLARYSSELMSAGVALSRTRQPYGWVGYRFPSNISYLSSAKPAREVRKSLAKKIGGLCHCASRTAIQDYLPLFAELFRDKEKAKSLAPRLELEESEIEFLNPSISGKQLLKEAEKTKKQKNPAQQTLLA